MRCAIIGGLFLHSLMAIFMIGTLVTLLFYVGGADITSEKKEETGTGRVPTTCQLSSPYILNINNGTVLFRSTHETGLIFLKYRIGVGEQGEKNNAGFRWLRDKWEVFEKEGLGSCHFYPNDITNFRVCSQEGACIDSEWYLNGWLHTYLLFFVLMDILLAIFVCVWWCWYHSPKSKKTNEIRVEVFHPSSGSGSEV